MSHRLLPRLLRPSTFTSSSSSTTSTLLRSRILPRPRNIAAMAYTTDTTNYKLNHSM